MGNSEQDTAAEAPESGSPDPEKTDGEDGDGRKLTPKPEITDEHREKAKEMATAYQDERPTVALPGTGHTVTGQAVANWIDDDGKPKHGEPEDGGVTRAQVVGKTTGDEDAEEGSENTQQDHDQSDEANSGDAEEEAQADADTAKELVAESKKANDEQDAASDDADADATDADATDADATDADSTDAESNEQVSSKKG